MIQKASHPLILINTSRAEIVEEGALEAGFRSGAIWACGLDVYRERELPALRDERVLISPHIAGLSLESTRRMRQELIKRIEGAIEHL